MKKSYFLKIIILCFLLNGCATKAPLQPDDLKKLTTDELASLVIGNTLTYQAIWGRWAEYHQEDYTGYGGAWSTLFNWFGWNGDRATSTFSITDDAQICWRYTGEAQWANPKLDYCAIIYTDQGMYYIANTKNPRDPRLVGLLRELEIKNGDYFGLTELNNKDDIN